MGVDLCRESGESTGFSYGGWSMVLEIAQQYGWKPLGTEAPDGLDNPAEWSGEYCSSDGQRVTTADATALADAIIAAVADPNLHVTVLQMDTERRQEILTEVGPELAASYVGVRDFEEYRASLREFGEFCRGGAFTIE